MFSCDGCEPQSNCATMSCLPPQWHTGKRKQTSALSNTSRGSKRYKVTENDQDNLQIISSIVSTQMKQEYIAKPVTLNVKSLLDTIPFLKLLQDVTMDDDGADIPLVTRVYEEQYMRESMNEQELSCIMGSSRSSQHIPTCSSMPKLVS